MPTEGAEEQEGRNAPVTVKLTERQKRAAGVVAEIRNIGVSTLLYDHTVKEVVSIYDGFIEMARRAS